MKLNWKVFEKLRDRKADSLDGVVIGCPRCGGCACGGLIVGLFNVSTGVSQALMD